MLDNCNINVYNLSQIIVTYLYVFCDLNSSQQRVMLITRIISEEKEDSATSYIPIRNSIPTRRGIGDLERGSSLVRRFSYFPGQSCYPDSHLHYSARPACLCARAYVHARRQSDMSYLTHEISIVG